MISYWELGYIEGQQDAFSCEDRSRDGLLLLNPPLLHSLQSRHLIHPFPTLLDPTRYLPTLLNTTLERPKQCPHSFPSGLTVSSVTPLSSHSSRKAHTDDMARQGTRNNR